MQNIVPKDDSGMSSISNGLTVIKYMLSQIERHLRKFSIRVCSATSKLPVSVNFN